MKTKVRLQKLSTEDDKNTILRNLAKIMDIRVVELDLKTRLLCFKHRNDLVYKKVKQELSRIGYPIQKVLGKEIKEQKKGRITYGFWEQDFDG